VLKNLSKYDLLIYFCSRLGQGIILRYKGTIRNILQKQTTGANLGPRDREKEPPVNLDPLIIIEQHLINIEQHLGLHPEMVNRQATLCLCSNFNHLYVHKLILKKSLKLLEHHSTSMMNNHILTRNIYSDRHLI